jgi:hypothetical protein
MVKYSATPQVHCTTNFGWKKAQQSLTPVVDWLDGLIGPGRLLCGLVVEISVL